LFLKNSDDTLKNALSHFEKRSSPQSSMLGGCVCGKGFSFDGKGGKLGLLLPLQRHTTKRIREINMRKFFACLPYDGEREREGDDGDDYACNERGGGSSQDKNKEVFCAEARKKESTALLEGLTGQT
jgi:hypothetical protein